jgi:phage gpG-like protein
MRIYFDVFGEDRVAYDLLRFAGRTLDIRPPLLQVATDVRDITEERFERQGPGWAPLAPSTLQAKAAKGQDPRILHATQALRESLTRLGGKHVEIVADDSLLMATQDEKARYHQEGTSRMPARKVVDFSRFNHEDFVRTIQRYIVEGDMHGGVWALAS